MTKKERKKQEFLEEWYLGIKLDHTLSIRVEEALYKKLTRAARLDTISVGKLCRNLLQKGLEEWQKEHVQEK